MSSPGACVRNGAAALRTALCNVFHYSCENELRLASLFTEARLCACVWVNSSTREKKMSSCFLFFNFKVLVTNGKQNPQALIPVRLSTKSGIRL